MNDIHFKYVDDGKLYNELEIPAEVHRTASLWNDRHDAIPNSAIEDEPEQTLAAKCREAVRSNIGPFRDAELVRQKSRDTLIVDENGAKTIRSETVSDLYDAVVSYADDSVRISKNIEQAQNQLRKIKGDFSLGRDARYAKNPMAAIGIACILLVLEAIISGVLLSGVTSTGLLGGWSLASLVGFSNVFLGATIGFFCLHWMRRRGRGNLIKFLGAVSVLLFTLTSVVLNLSLSYVRSNGLILNTTTELSDFWNGDILFKDMESLTLFVVGVLIFVWSIYKFHTLKDPVPELEAADRELLSQMEEFGAIKVWVRNQIGAIAKISTSRFENFNQKLKTDLGIYRGSLRESHIAAKQFHDERHRIIQSHTQCMLNRRAALKNATGQSPKYWGNDLVDLSNYLESEFNLERDEAILQKVESATEKALELLVAERAQVEDALRIARDSISSTEAQDPMKPLPRSAAAQIIALKERKA